MSYKSLSPTLIAFYFLVTVCLYVAKSHPSPRCKKWFYYDTEYDLCRPCVPCQAPGTLSISRECSLPSRCNNRNEQQPLRCRRLMVGNQDIQGVNCDWNSILGSTCIISQSGCRGEVTCQGNRTSDDLGYVIFTYWTGTGAACLPPELLIPITKTVLAPAPLTDAPDLENYESNRAPIVILTSVICAVIALATVGAALVVYKTQPKSCLFRKPASRENFHVRSHSSSPPPMRRQNSGSQSSCGDSYARVSDDEHLYDEAPDADAAIADAAADADAAAADAANVDQAEIQPLIAHHCRSRGGEDCRPGPGGDVIIELQRLTGSAAATHSEDAVDVQQAIYNNNAVPRGIEEIQQASMRQQIDNDVNIITETTDAQTPLLSGRLSPVENMNTSANSRVSVTSLQEAMASNERRLSSDASAGNMLSGGYRTSTDGTVGDNDSIRELSVTLRDSTVGPTNPTDLDLTVDNMAQETGVKEVVGLTECERPERERPSPTEHDEQLDAQLSLISCRGHEGEEHSYYPHPLQVTDRSMDHKNN